MLNKIIADATSVSKVPDTLNCPHISYLSVCRVKQDEDGTLNEQSPGEPWIDSSLHMYTGHIKC